MQNFHNAIYREVNIILVRNGLELMPKQEEREMMPTLQHFGVGSIPWSPLAGGRELLFASSLVWHPILTTLLDLARPHDKKADTERSQGGGLPLPESAKKIIDKVSEIATRKGISMAQVALAWSLSKTYISAPIVGTTSIDKLEDLIKGCQVELTKDEIKEIDDLYEPQGIIGHS